MGYVHVAHDCIIRNNVIFANLVTLGGHVEVNEWASIGGRAFETRRGGSKFKRTYHAVSSSQQKEIPTNRAFRACKDVVPVSTAKP